MRLGRAFLLDIPIIGLADRACRAAPDHHKQNAESKAIEYVPIKCFFELSLIPQVKMEWLIDIPAEIRVAIYKYYLPSTVKVHATQGAGRGLCRQLQFADHRTHLGLLRTCKQIGREASEVFYQRCECHIADCHCWTKGKVPASARQDIRNIVSPQSALGQAMFRLRKTLDVSDLPKRRLEAYQRKRLTYLTTFGQSCLNGSGRSTAYQVV